MKEKFNEFAEKSHPIISFQPSILDNSFITPGARYSNENMREIIASAIMVHEYPFSVFYDDIWMWVSHMQTQIFISYS